MSESTDRPGDGPSDPTAPPADAAWPAFASPSPADSPPPAPPEQPRYAPPPSYPPPAPSGQYPAYGQPPAYPVPQPGYSQGPYAPPAPNNGSALALTITSAVGIVACCAVTIPSLIFGIVALTQQATDPVGSAKMAKYGWIAFGIGMGLAVLGAIAYFAMIAGLIATAATGAGVS